MVEAGTAALPGGGSRPRVARRWRHAALLLWFVAAFLVYLANEHGGGWGDSVPAALIPVTVLLDGTVLLDRFAAEEHARNPRPYWLVETPAGTASFYPVATGILALPILAVPILRQEWRHPLSPAAWRDLAVDHYQKIAAAVLAALSVALFWHVARALDVAPSLAAALTALYAFGSETWSTSSQGLWQHGPGSLALLGAIAGLVALERRPWTGAIALGLCLGLMIAIRPTNLLLAAPLLLLALWRRPRWVPLIVVAAIPVLAPFVAYNLHVFGSVFGGYGSPASQLQPANAADGLAGVLLSPGRGLLPYFPVALLALALLLLRPAVWRNGLVSALAAGIVLAVGLVASWPMWWGGHCFGPRLLTETQGPILLLVGLSFPIRPTPRRVAAVALGVALAASITIQAVGVYSPAAAGWNSSPTNVDEDHDRLWRFADNPVFRGLFGRPGG